MEQRQKKQASPFQSTSLTRPSISYSKHKLDNLKDDFQLFSILFISGQSLKGDLSAFSNMKIKLSSIIITKCMLHLTVLKSQLLYILEQGTNTNCEQPNTLINGAAKQFDGYMLLK